MTLILPENYGPQVPRYGQIDAEYSRQLAVSHSPEPIYMLNLTKYRRASDRCDYPAASHLADARYAPIPLLSAFGATLCFVADVTAGLGDWDQVSVVSYPSRRAFVGIARDRDFQDWHVRKQEDMDRTAVLGLLAVDRLPAPASTRLVLLEIWRGTAPDPVADGPAVLFDVEGTLVGDGRHWSGIRHTAIEPGTPLPLEPPRPDYQALLLEPAIEHWQWAS